MVALADMQGRLMGKRFHAAHFLENHDETHCCNYLLATDLEMNTVQGYGATSWAAGYGDYTMKPDLPRCAACHGRRAPPSAWSIFTTTARMTCAACAPQRPAPPDRAGPRHGL